MPTLAQSVEFAITFAAIAAVLAMIYTAFSHQGWLEISVRFNGRKMRDDLLRGRME